MTLCSPDPQASRPPEEKVNVLQVRLPTNFKSARVPSDAHTAILRRLGLGVEPGPGTLTATIPFERASDLFGELFFLVVRRLSRDDGHGAAGDADLHHAAALLLVLRLRSWGRAWSWCATSASTIC